MTLPVAENNISVAVCSAAPTTINATNYENTKNAALAAFFIMLIFYWTSSMIAISAASPLRGPVLIIRV